jgi:hypothetical protein
MKFLEKHSEAILDGKDSPLARGVEAVDISEVAAYYFKQKPLEPLITQFPSCISPRPVIFMEYKLPQQWMSAAGVPVASGHGAEDYFGLLIIQEELPSNFTGTNPTEGNLISNLRSRHPMETPRYKQFTFYFAGNMKKHSVFCWMENYVAESGKMMGGPVHDVNELLISRQCPTQEEAVSNVVSTYGFPCYLALSAMTNKLTMRRQFQGKRHNFKRVHIHKLLHAANGDVNQVLNLIDEDWKTKVWGEFVEEYPGDAQIMEELKTWKFKIK